MRQFAMFVFACCLAASSICSVPYETFGQSADQGAREAELQNVIAAWKQRS